MVSCIGVTCSLGLFTNLCVLYFVCFIALVNCFLNMLVICLCSLFFVVEHHGVVLCLGGPFIAWPMYFFHSVCFVCGSIVCLDIHSRYLFCVVA